MKKLKKKFLQINDFSSGSYNRTFLQQILLYRSCAYIDFLKEQLKFERTLPLQLS